MVLFGLVIGSSSLRGTNNWLVLHLPSLTLTHRATNEHLQDHHPECQ